MDRGVVAAPGILHPRERGLLMERPLSSEELRYYLLYWDRVVIPGNNLVYIGVPEEQDALEAGAIERPRVAFSGQFQGDQVAYAVLACQALVAEELVKDESIDWVIHQFGPHCLLPNDYAEERNTLRVDLLEALPVPAGEVPLPEVLEFKETRKDELDALHEELDQLYQEALQAPDTDLQSRKTVSDLRQRIKDLDAVTHEKFRGIKRFDLSAELNLSGKDIVTGASGGSIIDFFATGYTVPLGAVIGAVASTIRIRSKATNSFEAAKENSKLAYLASAEEQGIAERRP